ncbi:MAG: ABC transporter substrate-binding protein [Thermodesulfobacteriota bacterium]
MSRRDFLAATGSLALAAGLPASRLWATPVKPREVSIGLFGPSHCAAPFVFTRTKGLFERRQLAVNLVNYPAMPLIAKDLIAGTLDFGQLIVPLAFAIHTGAKPFEQATPLVIPQVGGTNGAALMVAKASNIKAPGDFMGKTLSNHSKLSVHYLLNMMFLEMQGLDWTRDVNFRIIELDDSIEAMQRGDVDSFVMPEPKNAVVEAKGIGTAYMFSKYLWPNHPCCALVTRRQFFEDHRELVTDVTRATTEGGLVANEASNREELVDLLRASSDFRYDQVPKPVLQAAFTPGRSDFFPFPFQSSARVIIEIMKRYGLLAADIDEAKLAAEVFLSDLSRSVLTDLGVQAPATNFRPEKILGKLKEYGA